GYLLDQIRINGEKTELVEEVTALAKRYGIATPYTSYLIVPDGTTPVVNVPQGKPNVRFHAAPEPAALRDADGKQAKVVELLKRAEEAQQSGAAGKGEGVAANFRGDYEDRKNAALPMAPAADQATRALQAAREQKEALDKGRQLLYERNKYGVQSGNVGVNLSICSNNLKCQNQVSYTAQRNVGGRNCLEVGGVWIDDGYKQEMQTVTVRAQSNAYFRLLEKRPELKEVFKLGNYLVWVTPNGTALVIDTKDGKAELPDSEIDKLFVAKK
ncbi:MAG: hypothetical protein AB7K24_24660, partial [Gemmataceae bacterium]